MSPKSPLNQNFDTYTHTHTRAHTCTASPPSLPAIHGLHQGVYEGAESLANGRDGHKVMVRESAGDLLKMFPVSNLREGKKKERKERNERKEKKDYYKVM